MRSEGFYFAYLEIVKMDAATYKDVVFCVSAGLIIALCVYPATKPLFGDKRGPRYVGTGAVVGLCLIGLDRNTIGFIEEHYAALAVALLISVASFIWAHWKAQSRKRRKVDCAKRSHK